MKKLAMFVAVIAAASALFAAPAFADSPGQLAGGDLYQVRNVTKNTGYSNSVAAACDETVKYSFKLSNTEYGMLYDVNVKANLSNGSASATATNSAEEAISVSDTAAVSLSKGTLKYVAGSTQLFTVEGTLIKGLADGVTAGGVDAGNLAGSTRKFVQFQAKVDCPEVPEDKNITVCRLADKKIVVIKESQYDASKYSKDLKDCAPKPEQPGEITVCELSTGKIVTISEDAYDSNKHSKNLKNAACVEEEAPVVTELPRTGAGNLLAAVVLSTLAAGIAYAAASRKNILG